MGAAMNMPAMALLDRNGFYGSPRFHISAEKLGIKAHIGVEISVKDENAGTAEPGFAESSSAQSDGQSHGSGDNEKAAKTKAKSQEPGEIKPVYYPLLCESRTGYQNLCRLLTRTKLRVPKHAESWATLEELEEHAAGTICLTGDESGRWLGPLRRAALTLGASCWKSWRRSSGQRMFMWSCSAIWSAIRKHATMWRWNWRGN